MFFLELDALDLPLLHNIIMKNNDIKYVDDVLKEDIDDAVILVPVMLRYRDWRKLKHDENFNSENFKRKVFKNCSIKFNPQSDLMTYIYKHGDIVCSVYYGNIVNESVVVLFKLGFNKKLFDIIYENIKYPDLYYLYFNG